jgi:hypothetical protein
MARFHHHLCLRQHWYSRYNMQLSKCSMWQIDQRQQPAAGTCGIAFTHQWIELDRVDLRVYRCWNPPYPLSARILMRHQQLSSDDLCHPHSAPCPLPNQYTTPEVARYGVLTTDGLALSSIPVQVRSCDPSAGHDLKKPGALHGNIAESKPQGKRGIKIPRHPRVSCSSTAGQKTSHR